jgi:hypothetical protein
MPTTAQQLLELLAQFDWAEWSKRLRADIEPIARDVVLTSGEAVFDEFSLDDPFTSRFLTKYIGERIVQLDEFTKENVSELIRRVFDEQGGGLTPFELGQVVADEVRKHVKGYETWRANRIARTESAYNYNHGTVLGGHQAGVEEFNVTDGDKDGPCASANGAVWPLERCLSDSLAHPNCTRAFTARFDKS